MTIATFEFMGLNTQLHKYFKSRSFATEQQLDEFLARAAFRRPKPLYFDEVENANVWSFFLVDRDLHHTFEDYILSRYLPPYAIWSRPERQNVSDGIGRATFPISETAALYRQPVPKAGDSIDYTLEVLCLSKKSAMLGFLGFLTRVEGKRYLEPSVASAWLRVFVEYDGEIRQPVPIPSRLREILERDLAPDFKWTDDHDGLVIP